MLLLKTFAFLGKIFLSPHPELAISHLGKTLWKLLDNVLSQNIPTPLQQQQQQQQQLRPATEDSDTGMESLSSAETPATAKRTSKQCLCCQDAGDREDNDQDVDVDDDTDDGSGVGGVGGGGSGNDADACKRVQHLLQEVNKLKCDKLQLLRQNVVRT